ncbi:hypothetical protein T05_8912 [Trichinella murrelli]|uniref:Uncharacterized protein n=1 Tax=Trichinella murrelli TaxID=144512 RepID=A0A0V0TK91_9BILA|nr:hypothetical protein T05_8912 [Trichinella murrelli]
MVLACHLDIRDYIIRNNYSCHQKFLKVITKCQLISLQISTSTENWNSFNYETNHVISRDTGHFY